MQDIIKKELHNRFITEAATPGITNTKKVQDEEGKVNKEAQSDIKKEMTAYDKASGSKAKDDIKPPKRELSKTEDEVVDNSFKGGLEDLQYDSEVSDTFKERQKMAIEGDSKMGNETKTGEWNPETGEGNGNTEPVWGASNVDFGKNLIDKAKARKDAQDKATEPMRQFGNDIELIPKGTKTVGSTRKVAVESENKKMRLKFKNPFNGLNNAIKLIPESYKIDNKEFEITDGNESYNIRWEGSLNEGEAVVLRGTNKAAVNEDLAKIKHLFDYKSTTTKSTRLDENEEFKKIYSKIKTSLEESEE